MTISSTITKSGPYNGNDSTTVFSYGFKIFADADLQVVHATALGAETILSLGVDYSVSGAGDDAGGSVTYPLSGSPLPTGETLTIISDITAEQTFDTTNQAGFFPENHETAFDIQTRLTQQLEEEMSRAVKATVSSGIDPDNLIASIATSESNSSASAAAALISENNAASSEAAALAAANEWFKATENTVPDMKVLIKPGRVMYGGTLATQAQQTTTTITAPVGNPRIDRIVIDEQTGAYSIVAGTEAASPSAPAIPAGKLPVCQTLLDNSPATTAITDSLITDERIITRSYDATLESHGVLAPYKNLVIKNNATNPIYQIDIDADTLNLGGVLVSGVNLTVDLTIAAGINGLDTGTETNNTIYHIWGITNGTTTAGLISLSSTWAGVNKTNISGYDYAGYLGAFFNTAISINTFEQHGNKVACLISGPTLGSATSYTSVTTTEIPSTAKRISGNVRVTLTTTGQGSINISPESAGTLGELIASGYIVTGTGDLQSYFNLALLAAQTFYYKVFGTGASGEMNITGWEY